MKVLVAIDHHFQRDPDGNVYLGPPMSICGSHFWERYLSVFEEVVVLARVKRITTKPVNAVPADGQRIYFHDLQDYLGPWEYLRARRAVERGIKKAVSEADAFVLRVPGAVGQLAWQTLRRRGLPYALEVVADPWDLLSPGATRSIVRPVARHQWSKQLQLMCKGACAACYVTKQALQERYPPGPDTWKTYASDVDIGERLASLAELQMRLQRLQEFFRGGSPTGRRIQIGFLGALAQMYKAPDVLLRAAAICLRDNLNLQVAIAGDGKFRGMLGTLAIDLGIRERVRFLGALSPGEQVWGFLDDLDLFVLPSRQEGLPRAMVEAMARGCPCIGSSVGGIPELLQPEDLVHPGDAASLARKLREVLTEPDRMERMVRQSWHKAKEFLPADLAQRRLAFYQRIRERVEKNVRVELPRT